MVVYSSIIRDRLRESTNQCATKRTGTELRVYVLTVFYNGITYEDYCFMQTHSITLGRNIPNAGKVTKQMWNEFLKSDVLPLLEYATITEGIGIYKGELEQCMVLSVTTDDESVISNLQEVGTRYKKSFNQECILYSTTVNAEFILT